MVFGDIAESVTDWIPDKNMVFGDIAESVTDWIPDKNMVFGDPIIDKLYVSEEETVKGSI